MTQLARIFLLAGATLLNVIVWGQEKKVVQHQILFCGERIPVEKDFVAEKLMNVIRKQVPNVNLSALRARTSVYFPYIENYLRKVGLPEDFKYLPVVESGFQLLTSSAGAGGIWQLMPKTAAGLGLEVSSQRDERNNLERSTAAACHTLATYYNQIRGKFKVASWVLTAAAYNFGIGNIFNAIKAQGADYFSMNLNPETAAYVYKIIAVKELFEYPELYMKSFGYNVFRAAPPPKKEGPQPKKAGPPPKEEEPEDLKIFETMTVNVETNPPKVETPKPRPVYIAAHIVGKYRDFQDGDLISIVLDEDLNLKGEFLRKGKDNAIKGSGWFINDRIFVDLGMGHAVTLCDEDGKKGIEIGRLDKGLRILLKNEMSPDDVW